MNSTKKRHFEMCFNDSIAILQHECAREFDRQMAETASQGGSAILHLLRLVKRKFIVFDIPAAAVSCFLENLANCEPSNEKELEELALQICERVRPLIDSACNAWIRQSIGIMQSEGDADASSDKAARAEIEMCQLSANANVKRAAEKGLLKRLISNGTTTEEDDNSYAHNSDFRSVKFAGVQYSLTPNQARVVGILWQAYDAGCPSIGFATIQEQAGIESQRMRDIFKGHQLTFKAIISEGEKRGTFRLNR